MWAIVFLVALGVAAIFNLVGNLRSQRKIIFASKPLLMPFIIGFYIASTASVDWLIVIALLFGLGGDIILLWKDTSQKSFPAGLLSFLIGHVCYIIAFGMSTGFFSTWQWWFIFFVVLYVLAAWGLYRMLRAELGTMKVPVIVYMAALLAMSMFALSRMFVYSGFAFWLVFTGSILFVISDTTLGIEHFKKHDEFLHGTVVMATYILAQLFIAAGFII